jgi:hypothetical protein
MEETVTDHSIWMEVSPMLLREICFSLTATINEYIVLQKYILKKNYGFEICLLYIVSHFYILLINISLLKRRYSNHFKFIL